MDKKHSKIIQYQRQYSNHQSNLVTEHIQLLTCNTTTTIQSTEQRQCLTNPNQSIIINKQKRTRTNNADDDNDDDDDDEHIQSIPRKRIRYNQYQSENEPPHINIRQHSLYLYQPKLHSQITTNNNSHLSTSTLFNQFYSTTDNHVHNSHSTLVNSSLYTRNLTSENTTAIHRTGNISPAYSDTSTESTSTCSSDEQQFQLFHYQTTRSNRQRENYEQLLDLAEKLADPNRCNQINIEQFISYRYKTSILTDETTCVICMSFFQNGQRIRVLPCQHEYHTKCIARWFTMNLSCPICRRDQFFST